MLNTLHVYLVKPTQYDEDGYVVRHWRGVLPSNTLACLAGLTEDVAARRSLGPSLRIRTYVLDETVDAVPVRRICRSHRRSSARTVVCLAGVQTNQFPRAADLARRFRAAGLAVMIGGFHVTGYLSLLSSVPAEMQALMDAGVSLVMGEIEGVWEELLRDAATGRLQPLYNLTRAKPDLGDKPLPVIRREYLRKFIAPNFGTLDCGRGCPYACSFCTVIHVQGRQMRFRPAARIAEAIQQNFERHGVTFYFFTDDNFARNKNWEAIFDALVELREKRGVSIRFMIQADVLSWKIPNFVAKARRAGCSSVFIGMESLNPENLAAAGKRQNHVDEYSRLIEAYREAEISTHVGYIIGFPGDTQASVRRDLARLTGEVRPDHASFFMLTPLPGSQDHLTLLRAGKWMHPDFNLYDSWHAVTRHERLPGETWTELYREAWRTFYSFENMKAILLRCPRRDYGSNLFRFLWYKNSIQTEGRHPMMCGFFRQKRRRERRPGLPLATRRRFWAARIREIRSHLSGMLSLLFEMEALWLATRWRREGEQRVVEELSRITAAVHGRIRIAHLQLAYQRSRAQFPAVAIPSRFRLSLAQWCPLLAPGGTLTRSDLDRLWLTVRHRWRERRWASIPWFRAGMGLFRELQLGIIFALRLARSNA